MNAEFGGIGFAEGRETMRYSSGNFVGEKLLLHAVNTESEADLGVADTTTDDNGLTTDSDNNTAVAAVETPRRREQ
ncbi:MAG: hypothetical protein F2789_12215 [Actinobacteria bacterium]|nr:hypothetical protein [Actinomycetota bacterium]